MRGRIVAAVNRRTALVSNEHGFERKDHSHGQG